MSRPLKRGKSTGTSDHEILNTDKAIQALGYVSSDKFLTISSLVLSSPLRLIILFLTDTCQSIPVPTTSPPEKIPESIHNALRTIPPRPYTDSLVQNFFANVNYQYCILHESSFLSSYKSWWLERLEPQTHNISDIVFAGLILRICANSTQFLPSQLRSRIESELGDSAEKLSTYYHNAAEKLNSFFAPGIGGIAQVQQLFLGATWWKAEAEFVLSWHALGAAVRHGQEIGNCPIYP